MAMCARAVQQADGSLLLALDPAAPNLLECPYVVQSGVDVANGLFSLSATDGAYVSLGIISVWVTAYLIRTIIRVVRTSES